MLEIQVVNGLLHENEDGGSFTIKRNREKNKRTCMTSQWCSKVEPAFSRMLRKISRKNTSICFFSCALKLASRARKSDSDSSATSVTCEAPSRLSATHRFCRHHKNIET